MMKTLPLFELLPVFPAWVIGLIAFFSVMITEICWVLCVRWTAHTKMYRAAGMASFMVIVSWSGLVVLLGNPLVAVPCEMAGAFVGCIAAIKLDTYTRKGN